MLQRRDYVHPKSNINQYCGGNSTETNWRTLEPIVSEKNATQVIVPSRFAPRLVFSSHSLSFWVSALNQILWIHHSNHCSHSKFTSLTVPFSPFPFHPTLKNIAIRPISFWVLIHSHFVSFKTLSHSSCKTTNKEQVSTTITYNMTAK